MKFEKKKQDDYKIEKESRELFDINEKMGGMDLEKEKFSFCVRKNKELKINSQFGS